MKSKCYNVIKTCALMRFLVLQLVLTLGFVGLIQATTMDAQVLDKKVSVHWNKIKLENALEALENQADIKFVYSKSNLNLGKEIDYSVEFTKLGTVLEDILLPNGIDYNVRDKNFILLKPRKSLLLKPIETDIQSEIIAFIKKQNITVSGNVVDENGEALIGVNVQIKGTTTGTSTDIDGNYTLSDVNENSILVFSYIGYFTQEISLDSRTVLNVTLNPDYETLDEVIVVGYGTQKKINVTGSVAYLKTDDVVTTPVTNVKSLLVGQMPGIISLQSPGLPGSDNVGLSIRGFGNPLVIVDGVESYLDRLDPNDIESISVLKDASAAIYGVRGGDGVILVTTKRGKAGKMQINYHGYVGNQKPVRFPKQANAAEYIRISRNALFNGQYNPSDPNATIDYGDFTEEYLQAYESGARTSYDWIDAMLKDSGGLLASNNISASGGNERVRYYSSFSYLAQNSIFTGDYKYNKFTITNNLDADLTDNLSFQLTSSYIGEKRDYASSDLGAVWNDLRTAQPFFNPHLPDPDRAPYSGFTERSPIARTQQKFGGYNRRNLGTLAAAADLNYRTNFLPGLSFGGKVNTRVRRIYDELLNKSYVVYRYENDVYSPVQTVNSIPNITKGYTSSGDDPRVRLLSRVYANYETTNDKHRIGGLVFAEREDNEVDALYVTRTNLLSDDAPTITAGDDALTTTSGYATPLEYSRISFAGRLNYAYDEKYLFEATLRADASSKVSPKVRWGYFPSLSFGWNMNRENFMLGSAFEELKLRLSYSETGKDDNIGDTSFDYLTGFNELGTVYYLDGVPVTNIITAGLPNDRLTWIKNTLYNIGLDFSVWSGALYGSIDAFYRVSEGLVAADIETVPSTFGATLPQVNLNSTNDRGFEFLTGYRHSFGDFKFQVSTNLTYAREKYQDWAQDIDLTDPNQVRINKLSGNYVNRSFGYISDGLFNTQAEVDAYLDSHTISTLNGTPKVGDIRIKDVSGPNGTPDGVLDLYDSREIGYGSTPDLTYGFNTAMDYKNFSLSFQLQGASMFNVNFTNLLRAPFNNEVVPLTLHDKYSWTQDPNNPGVGNNPDAYFPAYDRDGTRAWNNNFSDYWQKTGTYLRIKTATLSYRLPNQFTNQMNIRDWSFYLSGDNLYNFSKLGLYNSIVDPEQAYNNGGYSLPLLRSFTFGIRLGF